MNIIVMKDIKQVIDDNLELLFRYNDEVDEEIFCHIHDSNYSLGTEELIELVRYVLNKLASLEYLYDLREL